jgi:two-component system chemotaxis sensor kinase CheA
VNQVLEELEDRVEQVFAATEQLRGAVGDGKSVRQLLDSIFRNVHSLKATASANGLNDTTHIAHQFENLLHALRVGNARMSDDVLRAFDDTGEALFSSLRQTKTPKTESPQSLFERLQLFSQQLPRVSRPEVELILSAVPPEIWQPLSQEEKHRLEQAVGEGGSLFLIETCFDTTNFDQLFQQLKEKLKQKGELISTAPKIHNEKPGKIDFRILYARECDLGQIKREVSDIADINVTEISAQEVPRDLGREKNLALERHKSTRRTPDVIRIDLDDLDRLISLTQRLFRETNACFDRVAGMSELRTNVNAVNNSFLTLAAELVNLRMVPIDRVLQRASRAGRSAAAAAGKDVEVIVGGHELRIDKALSDAISDPLVHLVRNAVDHGIENAEQRQQAGKNKRGKICIEASSLQGQTRIRVTDDGRGIDPKSVASAGKRLGVLDGNAELGVDQSQRLIFLVGFSTAASLSETSGRGVGLNVVETAIEDVGGAIGVASEPGVGSVFEIRLPVTFGLLDVVVVREGGHHYLIDAAQVSSIEKIDGADTEVKEGESLLRLDELLGLGRTESKTTVQLVYKYEKCGSLTLQVNEFVDREQVLIRNLGSRGGRWLGVAGAAEMRDGTVALLLDLRALMTDTPDNELKFFFDALRFEET